MLAFVQWFYHGRLGCSLVLSIALHVWNIWNTLYKYKYIAICRIIMDDNEWERKKTVLNNFVFLWRRDACHFLHIHGTYYICIYLKYELFLWFFLKNIRRLMCQDRCESLHGITMIDSGMQMKNFIDFECKMLLFSNINIISRYKCSSNLGLQRKILLFRFEWEIVAAKLSNKYEMSK